MVLGRLDLRLGGGRGGIVEVLESSDLGSIRQELVAVREAIEARLGAVTRSEAEMLQQHERRMQAAVSAFAAERERLLAQLARAGGKAAGRR